MRSWKNGDEWGSNITTFTHEMKQWNQSVFGNITYKKHHLLNRLHGISRSLDNGWNPFHLCLQKELWGEYEKVLYQEDILWYQKSRCKWLKYGDMNTKFFHGTTVFRRKRQRVEALQDSNGTWVNDPDQLKDMAISYFHDLYMAPSSSSPFSVRGCFPSLTNKEYSRLASGVSTQEIPRALFDMGGGVEGSRP